MSSTTSSIRPSASANSTANRAPPQAGIFEGLNPTVYNPADPIVLFIIQATIVIALCRLLYWPLSKIRQPPVIAEVITGILLGPSVFGRIPNFTATIFPSTGMAPFTLAANIGLILYLFLVGLEIDLRFLVSNWRIATSVASLDMAIPFGMGYAIAYGLYNEFRNEPGTAEINFATFGLFIAIAIAITAFPVLCRILTSLNLLNTNIGVIVLSSGIANDVVGWVLLALCVTLVNSGSGLTSLWVLLTTIGFALFLAFAVRPCFMYILRRTHSLENGPTQGVVALTIFILLGSAFFTSVIGAHSVFGAFMVGLMCPHEGGFAIKLTEKLEDLIATLFLPLFFARSGLNTNLGLLDSGIVWGYVVAVIMVAFFSKIFGGMMGARLNGLLWRESLTIGCLISCKGLVELIVLNIGFQARILSTRTFTMFVVMALVTTFATTPLVSWTYPPSYQRKLKLWKEGKIDWDGNPLNPEDHDDHSPKHSDPAERLLVYLRADGLSSLFSVVKLFTGARSTKPTNDSISPNTHSRYLRIHGLRLSELGERNSSVMKVSEFDEYAGNDPIVKAFGSTATYDSPRDVIVSAQLAVVPGESFVETIANKASSRQSDLVLIPWSETGTISELPSYLAGSTEQDPLTNRDFARLTSRVFEHAGRISNVGVFVDSTLIKPPTTRSPTHEVHTLIRSTSVPSFIEDQDSNAVTYTSRDGTQTHIHVFYSGSNDDLFAVRLAIQLAQNDRISITITQTTQPDQTSSEESQVNDTAFNDIQSYATHTFSSQTSEGASPRVIFDSIQGDTPGDDYIIQAVSGDRKRHTIFLLGRSGLNPGGMQHGDQAKALGNYAFWLIAHLKHASLKASLLVVQAKHSSDANASPAIGQEEVHVKAA